MGKGLIETTSLIDADFSSESIVETISSDGPESLIQTQSYATTSSNLSASATATVTASANTSNSTSTSHSIHFRPSREKLEKNIMEETSDVPSLADASDCEETESQTSTSSSSIYSIKEGGDETRDRDNDLNQNQQQQQQLGASHKPLTPWDDESDARTKHNADDVVVLGVISGESTNSTNTVKTSNRDTVCSSGSMETVNVRSFDDPHRPSPSSSSRRSTNSNTNNSDDNNNDNNNNNNNNTDSVKSNCYCESVLGKYITYLTDFFTCSTPTTNVTLSNDHDATRSTTNTSQHPSQTENDSNDFQQQLHSLQSCIENDILQLMGCSAEGAQHWINSLGDSLLCNHCSTESMMHRCSKCRLSHSESNLDTHRPKIRNRNVYVRQKALNRIRRLRQGGLSRNFSLSPVYTFLEEEKHHSSSERSARIGFALPSSSSSSTSSSSSSSPRRPSNSAKKGKGLLIPLSKRPRALGNETRQTSIGAESTTSYDSVVLITRSDETTIDEEYQDDDLHHNHHHQNHHHNSYNTRESICDMGASFGTDLGRAFLHRFCYKSTSSRNYPNSTTDDEYAAASSSSQDLYYDSDPGTRGPNPMIHPSELRKTFASSNNNHHQNQNQNSSQRSRTVGQVDDIAAELRRFESDFLTPKKSLIRSLDVRTFDVNDGAATSQLISELITSNFSLIWHPDKAVENWSGSCNATPHRVKAWFEMGSCLKKTLLQPKFVWRSNDSVLPNSNRQSKMKSIHSPESVELLNIVRIVAPTTIDRQMHPFVKKDCAFYIVTNSEEECLFETATRDERDKFLFAFKLMVARLASKIIVGDKDVFDEFFTPLGLLAKKKKKKRPIRRSRYRSDILMSGVKEGVETDSFSMTSETSGFSRAFIGTVEEESRRTDELWGTTAVH